MNTAEARFATALSHIPEAGVMQAEFAVRRDVEQRDCRAREDALLQAFRAALRALKGDT